MLEASNCRVCLSGAMKRAESDYRPTANSEWPLGLLIKRSPSAASPVLRVLIRCLTVLTIDMLTVQINVIGVCCVL